MKNDVQYFKGANWVTLSGSFTPKELRELAESTEEKYKEFKEANGSRNK